MLGVLEDEEWPELAEITSIDTAIAGLSIAGKSFKFCGFSKNKSGIFWENWIELVNAVLIVYNMP